MTQIKGKQLKDASIEVKKLSGISDSIAADKLLLTAANQTAQALTLAGDLSQAVTASTFTLTLKNNSVDFNTLDNALVVLESEGIGSNDNDTTLPTSAAVKDYVDAQVLSSGSMSSFNITDGTNTQTVQHADSITFQGTANEIAIAVSATDTVTVGLTDDVTVGQDLTATRDLNVGRDLVVTGNLTVNGTTTTVNSTTLSVDDKNVELGSVATPTDTTADGGGITLKGATDKTFNWVNSTDSWTSSEHLNLLSNKEYKIDNISLLTEDGAKLLQSSAVGNGLVHSAGIVSSKGFTVEHFDVNATITSGNIITDTNGNVTATSSVGQIELKVNGVAYQQGTSSAGAEKDWYLDGSSNVVWHGDFSLDNTDLLTLSYHPV